MKKNVDSALDIYEIELELEQVANYHDQLEMLTKYFIQPQLQQIEEDTDG